MVLSENSHVLILEIWLIRVLGQNYSITVPKTKTMRKTVIV